MLQALIAAGGNGKRVSPSINTKGSKPLIEYAGQSMFGHLIDSLKVAGVERYVISTAYHTHEPITKIVKSKNIKAVVIPLSETGFRRIAYYADSLLDERFLFVCGHQPLDPGLVVKIADNADRHECVATAYSNKTYPTSRNSRTILFEGSPEAPRLRFIGDSQEYQEVSPDNKYVSSPYVVSKALVQMSRDSGFGHFFGYYNYLLWSRGGNVGVVEANFPPEFDYDDEFRRTKEFLDSLQKAALTP